MYRLTGRIFTSHTSLAHMINIIIILITHHAGESKAKITNKKNSKTIGYSKIATRLNPIRNSSFYPSYCFLEHHTHRLKIKLIVAYSVSCTFYLSLSGRKDV